MNEHPTHREASIYNWLGEHVRSFVRWWREFDAWLNQPLPKGRHIAWRWLAPDGYAWFVPVLAAILTLAMALGPTVEMRWGNLGLLAIGFALLFLLHAAAGRQALFNQYLLGGQLVILAALALLLLVNSRPETYGMMTARPRLHVGVAIVCALVLALPAAWLLASSLFRSNAGGGLADSLPKVELFLPKNRYDFMGRGPIAALVSALVIAPIRYPVELLLPGSLLTLFVPDHYLWYAFGVTALVAWIVLFLGILFDRLMEILKTVGRLFFIGPQRVISVLVIVVAVLRLADVHYITYLFNAGSRGYGNTTIMRYIVFAYAVAWYYGFWCDHFVARRLMRLIDKQHLSITPVEIAYDYEGSETLSTVRNRGRTIALHGAGRLKIEGRYEDQYQRQTKAASNRAIQFMTPAEMLAQFRTQLERLPAGQAPTGDLLASLRNFQRSTLVYPALVGALAYGLIGGPAVFSFLRAIQPPGLAIRSERHVNKQPSTLLFESNQPNGGCGPLQPTMPRIAVVASGGGTRAAIYTASLLRGLAEHDQICNVVLVSGVSGGSAALGYFALHEKELRRPRDTMDVKAWDDFSQAMALPFIEQVIDGASDMRFAFGRWRWASSACHEAQRPDEDVTGWIPARSRLGAILAESFVCHMGTGTMEAPSFGLMLNTAIVGSFSNNGQPCQANHNLSLPERATRCRQFLDAGQAGGRLVLTNLAAPASPPDDGSLHMQLVTLDNADISIARAAALSANFPPVFPDAAIDIEASGEARMRYWVTDGGAVENRGAMTLYYSIRDAFRSAPQAPQALPPLHVVIADVSASAGRYSESFGFGSVLGAGGQLGLGLETELRAAIERLYCDHSSEVSIHEIAMPRVFRDGGIGTHWLLPNSLSFANPAKPSETEILSAHDVETLVLALHNDISETYQDEAAAKKVKLWAQDDAAAKHDANWKEFLASLTPTQSEDGCQVQGGIKD
ncbi:patatin-like phospholipase family protein [Rhizobium johnstonii]|uniref:patatin-like phospholipase family protein n=1 Tax=Rhizobium johnstonii TaxID=3019933 RepID=UPI003F9C9E1F